MTKLRKKLQNILRKKYGWHSSGRASSDISAWYYKTIKGRYVPKKYDLGCSSVDVDFEIGGVLGDTHITLTEYFLNNDTNVFNASIGLSLSFEELESLYLVAREIRENRNTIIEN